MTKPIRVLYLEDNPADAQLFQKYLREAPGDYRVQTTECLSDGLNSLKTGTYDIILLDLGLPDGVGIECLRRIHRLVQDVPVLILSDESDERLAKQTVHEGAQDYLIKGDISARALVRSIDYAIERKQTEKRILHLNGILRSLREINRSIAREKDEFRLLQRACDILHTEGGFSIVWVDLPDTSGPRIMPVAAAGLDIDLLKGKTVIRDDSPTGRGPTGTVISSKKTCVFTDLDDEQFTPWRDEIRRLGITLCVASPLLIDDVVFGVLNVYSRRPDPFSNEEIALIEEVAGDLSFAVSKIRAGQESERMSEALRESEERFRTLIDNLNDVIFDVDQEGYITYISPIVTQISGYASDEIIGRRFSEFLDESSTRIITGHFEDILSGNKSLFEVELKDKYGNDHCFRISSRLQHGPGQVLRISGVMSDITETRRVQEALTEQAEILDQIHDIVVTTDVKGNITSWNKGAERLIGYRADEIVGKPVAHIYPLREYEATKKRAVDGLRGNGEIKDEFTITRKDGTQFPVHLTLTLRKNSQGRTIGIIGSAVDISERKRTEEALRESEQRFRSLFYHNSDAVYSFDLAGNFLSVNRSTCVISGYPERELLAMSFMPLIAPEYLKETRRHITKAIRGQTQHYESCIITRDQRRVSLDVTNIPIVIDGKIAGVYGIAKDITERKMAEEALRESELRYRLVADNANDIIFAINMNLAFTYISPSVTRVRGFTVQEAMAQTPAEVLTPASFQVAMNALREGLEIEARPDRQLNRTRILELEERCKDGSTIWTETTFSILRDNTCTLVGFLGITRDITERKRNQEALRQSEEKFRSLFETSRDVVYISTAEGRFIDVNPAAEQTFGYTRKELLAINVRDLFKEPGGRERFRSAVAERGFVKDHAAQMKKSDGTIIDCLITATVRRDPEGAGAGYQGIIRDITDQKRMQRQIIQTEKLSSLGGMISGVAHELNNPLTSIIGNAQLLMRKEISPDFRKKLEVIQRESVRCTKIVGGLLSFAREHRPERRMIDVNTVVAESLRLREYDLKVNNVQVLTDLADDLPQTSADPHQLQQVFINLINNSHGALREKEGGTLSIRSFSKDNSIRVVFADDGPGIEPGNLNRIFDPFFTTKDVGKGTGLGLSIAYGIVNEHGGTIDVESRPGKGAAFTVEIPIVEGGQPIAEDEKVPSAHRRVGKGGILIVDDEEPLRRILAEALTKEGYSVKSVSGGDEAVKLLRILRFDCIISDFKMPGIGGKELYTFIRKHTPELSNRMLFMTEEVLGKDTRQFLEITGNPYIEKPFELPRLFSMIRQLLDKEK